jgi:hypothetical protein
VNTRNAASRCGFLLVCALTFVGTAWAAPSSQLIDGRTSIRLSTDFLGTLAANGFELSNILPGGIFPSETPPRVAFPVATGELDEEGPKLEIVHFGGMLLTAGDTRVALTTFIIDNFGSSLLLTGIVKTNDTIVGRGTLFRITLTTAPEITPESGATAGRVVIENADIRLTGTGANTLNLALGLEGVFTAGMRVGTANISARFRDRDG